MTESNKMGFNDKASKQLALLSDTQKKVLSSQYRKKMSIIFLTISFSLLLFAIIIALVMINGILNPDSMTSVDEETGEIVTNSPYNLITPCVVFALASVVLLIIYISKIKSNNSNLALKVILTRLMNTDTPFKNFNVSRVINLVSRVSGKQKIFFDYNKQLIVFKTKYEYLEPIPFKNIINYKVYENGSSIIESKVGKTIIGTAIAGLPGAIIANASARKVSNICNDLSLIIFVTNTPKQITLHFAINDNCDKTSSAYRNMQSCINNICAELENIIASNHSNSKAVSQQPDIKPETNIETTTPQTNLPNNTTLSISKSDLSKLKELYDEQLITKEEYEAKKKQILGI